MKKINKFFIALSMIVITLFGFSVWYLITYSMKLSDTYEINSDTLQKKLLIVTQGSEYKGAIVTKLTGHYKKQQVYIKVTDASYLPQINAEEWTAIAVLHTWEIGKPPGVVTHFLDRYHNFDHIVVLTTSGSGDEKAKVDATSGASLMENVPEHSEIMITRLNRFLLFSKK